jgi:phosphoglycolate phosphatase
MTLPKPTIVLFDLDGTTVRHINPKLLKLLDKTDDIFFKASKFFHRKQNFPYNDDAPQKEPPLLVHRMLHRMRRKPVEQIVQPYPGLFTLLNVLKDAGIEMGIVSNGMGKGYGYDILHKFHLEPYFTSKTFREHIARAKPYPDSILRGLSRFNREITDQDVVWYIGDRRKDVKAALAADKISPAKIIPFSYGIQAAIAILEKNIGPDHIIVNYHDFAAKIFPLLKQA